MKNRRKHFAALILSLPALALALAAPRTAIAQTTAAYTVTDLGIIGHDTNNNFSVANCINSKGLAGGTSSSASPTQSIPAALFSNGVVTNLGTLGGEYGVAQSINSSGDLAGYSTLSDGTYRAFLFSNGTMTDLGTLGNPYSVGYGLNDSGEVVGQSVNSAGQSHAFLFSNGTMSDLGTLGGPTSTATAINNAGLIVGYSYNAQGNFLGFTIKPGGKMTAIGTLGGTWSIAYGVNDLGQITGQGYTKNNLSAHAFLLSNKTMTDLGALEKFGGSWGVGINNAAQIVGWSTFKSTYHAFISKKGQPMQDLNSLIPANSGWVLVQAAAINSAGQIVGQGTHNGATRAFLLTPAK